MEPSNIGSNNGMANLIIQGLIAVGTICVAILAIWGEWFRSIIAGPKLEIKLHNIYGDLTKRADGRQTIYYHLKVENKRKYTTAKNVRIYCTGIFKRAPDGSFVEEPLVVPVQLVWAFAELNEISPDIPNFKICDLGFLDENADRFMLAILTYPNNFRGFITRGEAMRLKLITDAKDYIAKKPFWIEISWDGNWTSNLDEMRKHLVIKEVNQI